VHGLIQRHLESIMHMKGSMTMRKMMVFSSVVLSMLMMSTSGFAEETDKHATRATRMQVNGVVSKVQSGLTTVETSWGSMTIASATGPQKLEVGEEVEMTVNEGNIVIDVHRKGEPAHGHRYITGNLVYVGKMKREIKLWTPEGERVFPLERLEVKAGGIEEGALVTVELNEAGTVIDLQRTSVEISFDERPRTAPGYAIQVNGTVTKIQSGMIFVKTPVGQYTISAKTAPADAAVGDEMSLWVNEDNMVIDHHGKDQKVRGSHRLIFGKLIYVGRAKKEIKLSTPEGEKVFPLDRLEVKSKPVAEGSQIVVELNEDGTVIDLRKAQ